ncbi:MAG: NUDIX domain-containing protein [Candidatus Buchananbacteria bacterium]
MSEYLEIYDLKNKFVGVVERNKFYDQIRKEYKETGKISKKIKSIRVIIMNSQGRIYLQKRSKTKAQNPGLYDKTVGGHVPAGYSWEMAVIKECTEELGLPVAIVNEKEFLLAIRSTDLSVVGLLKVTEKNNNFLSFRKDKLGDFIQPYITTWYLGYYDGNLRFKDGEAIGLETFSVKELEQEIKENPENFTEDIKYVFKKYKKYLVPLKNFNN